MFFILLASSQSINHSSVGGCTSSLPMQHQQTQILSANNQGSASFFNPQDDVSSQNDNQVGMSSNMGNKSYQVLGKFLIHIIY